MRRPPQGATSRPGPCRPASGYGRVVGRPGPCLTGPVVTEPAPREIEPACFVDLAELAVLADLGETATGVEAPAPVIP